MSDYIDDISKTFMLQHDLNNRLSDSLIRDKLDVLLPSTAEILSITEAELKSRIKGISLSQEAIINGHTLSTDNWTTFNIEIAWGLCIFIYKITKLFLSRMSVRDDYSIIEETQISDKEMIEAARNMMSSFWDSSIFDVPSIPISTMTKGQIELSSYLVHFAESFCIGHELGHIIINSCPEKARRELLIANSTENWTHDYLSELCIERAKRERAIVHWPRELAADLFGLKLCLKLRDDIIGRMVIRAGASLLFLGMELLEGFEQKRTGMDYWATFYAQRTYDDHSEMDHPPTKIRLEFMQSYVDESFWQQGADQLSSLFNEWKGYILSKV